METRTAFCSACDRNVPVLVCLEDEPATERAPRASVHVTCLDYGVRCTGTLCPLFATFPPSTEGVGTSSPIRFPIQH